MKFLSRLFLSCLFSVGLITLCFGQKPQIEWGPEFKIDGLASSSQTIGITANGFYEVQFSAQIRLFGIAVVPAAFTIRAFDTDMKVIGEERIELKYKGNRRQFHSLTYMRGNLYLFTQFYDKKANTNTLFMDRLDLSTLKIAGESVVIASLDAPKRRRSGYFNTEISRDSTRLLVFYDYPQSRDRDAAERYGISVYDPEMNKLWSKEDVSIEYVDRTFINIGQIVDDDGNVYIIGKVYEGNVLRERRKGNPNYKYQFRLFSDKGETVQDYTFELGDRFITDLKLELDHNRHLACAGFIAENRTRAASGVFFFHLNPANFEVYGNTEKSFDSQTFELLRAREKTRKDEIVDFDINKLILRADGSAAIVAEQFYIVWQTFNDGNTVQTYPVFHRRNILVASINSLGEIEWTQIIPKKQVTRYSDYFSSYMWMVQPDRLVFFFNDNVKNLDAKAGDNVRNFTASKRRGIISMVSIDHEGKVTRDVLTGAQEQDNLLVTGNSRQFNNQQALIYVQRRRKVQYSRITF